MTSQKKGWLMAVSGASLWGLSGTAAQRLFQHEGIEPEWMVTVRMLTAGAILLAIAAARTSPRAVSEVWKHRTDRRKLLLFSLIGMLVTQYTYFAAIEAGNAATATLLQFLGPVFITVYVSLRARRLPQRIELAALGLACVGTFLLITNGNIDTLSVPTEAVFWGITSAVTAAFYMVYPVDLLNRWGSAVVVGWSMLTGGAMMGLVAPPWQFAAPAPSLYTWGLILFVVLFGTLLPFFLLLESVRHISPAHAGILSSAEPLTATLASALWLKTPLSPIESVGGACIIATVFLLSMNRADKAAAPARPSVSKSPRGM